MCFNQALALSLHARNPRLSVCSPLRAVIPWDPPPCIFACGPGHNPPGGQRGSGSLSGFRIADGRSHAIRARVARTDPCRRDVVAWSRAVVPPRLMSHAFAAMARASTEGVRARSLRQYQRRRALHTVTRVHVLAPQPNALLGARSNVARISQRGPHMLLAGEGLRSARAMPMLPQATESKPTHTVTKMASSAGEKKFNIDIQLILYFALWYLGNYYCTLIRPSHLPAAPS